jgi:hypothetical protein
MGFLTPPSSARTRMTVKDAAYLARPVVALVLRTLVADIPGVSDIKCQADRYRRDDIRTTSPVRPPCRQSRSAREEWTRRVTLSEALLNSSRAICPDNITIAVMAEESVIGVDRNHNCDSGAMMRSGMRRRHQYRIRLLMNPE